MKKKCPLIVFVFFLFLDIYGQHSGDFRSKIGGSGILNDSIAFKTFKGNVRTEESNGILPPLKVRLKLTHEMPGW